MTHRSGRRARIIRGWLARIGRFAIPSVASVNRVRARPQRREAHHEEGDSIIEPDSFDQQCTEIDKVLAHNAGFAPGFDPGDVPARPARRIAVVTCMDSRLDVHQILGLGLGEVHVIRNAGGVVTDDVLRSLVISQRLLGTDAVMVIHHTGCGMLSFRDDDLKDEIQAEVGIRPSFSFDAFTVLDDEVRQSKARLRACPFLGDEGEVRGFVYDVVTGHLREVP